MRERLGIVGTIRALEVTHGPNGWHPHLHTLVLTRGKLEDRATGELEDRARAYVEMVYTRWVKWITAPNKETGKVYRTPTRENGISFVPSHKDEYIAKLGLADELTRGSWKKSDSVREHRTPLQILQKVQELGTFGDRCKREVALWVEYADNMFRAKQLTWSKGLRKLYAMPDEQTDLELVEEDSQPGKIVHYVSSDLWDRRLKYSVDAQLRILAAAERGEEEAVLREIDRLEGLPRVPF
jgi:hypothetical protein